MGLNMKGVCQQPWMDHYHDNDPHAVFSSSFNNFRDSADDKEVRLATHRKQATGQGGIPSFLLKRECACIIN